MPTSKEPTPFEQWYNGMVGFHINSERIIYDLYEKGNGFPDPVELRKWMAVCWNSALEAAQEYNGVDVEVLKENI